MALTNYLTQSVILGLLFYGYGLGLSGCLGSTAAAAIGIPPWRPRLDRSWCRLANPSAWALPVRVKSEDYPTFVHAKSAWLAFILGG
jgi:Protein of unknown function (DUF418)